MTDKTFDINKFLEAIEHQITGRTKVNRMTNKVLDIKDFFEAIGYHITGSTEFSWTCFGPNARYIDCDLDPVNTVSISAVFDTVTQAVYSIEAWDYNNDKYYRWIDPGYVALHKQECELHGINPNEAIDDKAVYDVELPEDILEKVKAMVTGQEYDERITTPLDISEKDLFKLMTLAHEEDVTLNEYICDVLKVFIEELENQNGH